MRTFVCCELCYMKFYAMDLCKLTTRMIMRVQYSLQNSLVRIITSVESHFYMQRFAMICKAPLKIYNMISTTEQWLLLYMMRLPLQFFCIYIYAWVLVKENDNCGKSCLQSMVVYFSHMCIYTVTLFFAYNRSAHPHSYRIFLLRSGEPPFNRNYY